MNTYGQKWSKAGEILRELSGEAIQEEFYKHANSILEKYDYNFRLGIKEKTEEEKQLREKIKAEADLPKSKRSHNLYTYFEDEAKKQIESKNKEFRNFQKLAEKGNLYKEKIGLLKNRGNELKEYISEKQNENKILTDEIKNKQKEIQHLDQKILLSKKDISQKNDELEVINKELQFKKTMNKDLSLIDKFKIKMFDYVISVKNYFDTKLDFKLKGILSDSFDLFNYCNDDEKEKIKEIAEYTENKAINNIEDLPSNLRITQVLKSGNVGNDDITDPVKNKNSHKFKR